MHNLVASAVNGNQRPVAVVLGVETDAIRFHESEKLLIRGFRFFETITPIKAAKPLTNKRVWFGEKNVSVWVWKNKEKPAN